MEPTRLMPGEEASSGVSSQYPAAPKRALSVVVGGVYRLLSTVSGVLSTACLLVSYLRRELEVWEKYPLPLRQRVHAWSRGFMARDYALLGLRDGEPAEYLSSLDQAQAISPAVNPEYADVLESKIAFHLATGPHEPEAVPTFYGVVREGVFHPAPGYDGGGTVGEVVSAEGSAILKPATGTAGRGVSRVKRDMGFTINGERVDAPDLDAHVGELDGDVVVECVENHEYAAEVVPGSVNTIRVLTCVDPETDSLFVARAVHRFGNGANEGPTDNWSGGGFAAPVDLATGELGKLHTYAPETGLCVLDHHPESGALVNGREVPGWDEVRRTVLAVADIHRENPWVGWDVVVTPDGPVILEGNCAPHLALQQLGGGLLADERVRAFVEERA